MDLGFVKFKSNGTKAKRPLEQIQKAQGAKKKKKNFFFFFVFVGGFAWIFSQIKQRNKLQVDVVSHHKNC